MADAGGRYGGRGWRAGAVPPGYAARRDGRGNANGLSRRVGARRSDRGGAATAAHARRLAVSRLLGFSLAHLSKPDHPRHDRTRVRLGRVHVLLRCRYLLGANVTIAGPREWPGRAHLSLRAP